MIGIVPPLSDTWQKIITNGKLSFYFFLKPYKQYAALSLRLYILRTCKSCYTPIGITKGTFRQYMAFILRVIPVKLYKYEITTSN